MTHRIASLFALVLPLAAFACAEPREPNTAPPPKPPKPPKVDESAEPAPLETPAKDGSSGETLREKTFVSCSDESCGPEHACAAGSVGIKHSDRAGIECVPLVLQKHLGKPENWGHPVVIENPTLGSFDRKLNCKVKSCVYPGSMLPLDGTRFIPIGLRSDDAITHHYLSCAPGNSENSSRPGCPNAPTARLLGTVHPVTVPGQSGTLLTFQLLSVEPSSPSSDAR